MPNNPAKHVEPPKVPHKAMNILTEEQLEVFLAAADRDSHLAGLLLHGTHHRPAAG